MTFAAFWGWVEQVNVASHAVEQRRPRPRAEAEIESLADLADKLVEPEGLWCHLPLSRLSILHGVH